MKCGRGPIIYSASPGGTDGVSDTRAEKFGGSFEFPGHATRAGGYGSLHNGDTMKIHCYANGRYIGTLDDTTDNRAALAAGFCIQWRGDSVDIIGIR